MAMFAVPISLSRTVANRFWLSSSLRSWVRSVLSVSHLRCRDRPPVPLRVQCLRVGWRARDSMDSLGGETCGASQSLWKLRLK